MYRGIQLTEAVDWLSRNIANANEVRFIKASQTEQQRKEMEEESRLRRELNLKRQTVRHLRAFVVTLSFLLIFSIAFASLVGFLNIKLQIATNQVNLELQTLQVRTLLANANTTAAAGNIDTALLLADAAIKKQDTADTRNALLRILNLNPQLRKIQQAKPVQIPMLALDTKYHEIIYSEGAYLYIDNTDTGPAIPAFPVGKQDYINVIGLSPDDTTLAIANNEGVWLRNMQTQHLMQLSGVPDYSGSVTTSKHASLAFSMDGKILLSARCFRYDGPDTTSNCLAIEVAVWSVQQSTPVLSVVQDMQLQAPMNPDTFVVSGNGKDVAMSNSSNVSVWSIASGQLLPIASFASSANVNRMTFSPDGNMLAVSTDDNTIQMWSSTTGKPVGSKFVGHTDSITALAFSPDGKTLAASSIDKTTLTWNVATGQEQMVFNGDNQPKYGLAFSSDGQTICTSSYNTSTGDQFLFWDDSIYNAISQNLLSTIPMRSPIISSDNRWIYIGMGDGSIAIKATQETTTRMHISTTDYPGNKQNTALNPLSVHTLALNSKGTLLVAGRIDGSITIWDTSVQPPKIIDSLIQPHTPLVQVQLSSDGETLLSSDASGASMIWDISNPAHPSAIALPVQDGLAAEVQQNVALSPDGKRVAMWVCKDPTCSQDQIRIWNIAERTFSAQSSPVQANGKSGFLTFSPDNQTIASIISGNKIMLWNSQNPAQGTATIQITDPNSYAYTRLRFSPNGNRIVAYTLHVENTPIVPFSFIVLTKQVNTFEQLSNPIQLSSDNGDMSFYDGDMSFSNDGTQLIAAQVINSGQSYSGMLLLWNASESSWQQQACQIAQRELSQKEWQLYGDGEAYQWICS